MKLDNTLAKYEELKRMKNKKGGERMESIEGINQKLWHVFYFPQISFITLVKNLLQWLDIVLPKSREI